VIPALNEGRSGFPFPLLPRVARLEEGILTHHLNHVDAVIVSVAENSIRDGGHRASSFSGLS
jgi:hypothetical protein